MPHASAANNENMRPLTIIADSNIASLDEFFNASTLGQHNKRPVNIISVAGRAINAQLLAEYQPDVLLIR